MVFTLLVPLCSWSEVTGLQPRGRDVVAIVSASSEEQARLFLVALEFKINLYPMPPVGECLECPLIRHTYVGEALHPDKPYITSYFALGSEARNHFAHLFTASTPYMSRTTQHSSGHGKSDQKVKKATRKRSWYRLQARKDRNVLRSSHGKFATVSELEAHRKDLQCHHK